MPVRTRFTILVFFSIIGFSSCKTGNGKTKPEEKTSFSVDHLQVNMMDEPLGISPENVDFSWQINSSDFNVYQKAYQIEVSANKNFDKDLIWDSGKKVSDSSQHVSYRGQSLSYNKDYYWRVHVWTSSDSLFSSENKINHFFVKPKREDLNANWIGAINREDANLPEGRKMHTPTFKKSKRDSIIGSVNPLAYRSILLRKEIQIKKPIKCAKIFISGLGHYKLSLNGNNLGKSEFAPLWTDYDKTVYYNIYDVSKELKPGENVIGTLLGNGMYNMIGKRYSKFFISFGPPTLFLQLNVEYEDGTQENFSTDKSWKYSKSPITFNTIFGGEDYDARLEQPGWNNTGFNDSSWKKVVVQNPPKGQLIPQLAPEIKVTKTYNIQHSNKLNDSTYVFDMGQNLSGIPQIEAVGKKGQKIRVWVGEKLKEDGTISQGGSGKPYYYDYTFKGDSIEKWSPDFSYYGFQYIQVEGATYGKKENSFPELLNLHSLFIRNSAAENGSFHSSNELFNQAHQLINFAIKSNFQSVFTDCPHREKLGWLEETHLNGPGLFYNYNLESFIPKVMRDIKDAQRPNGLIPNIAPEYVIFGGDFTDSPEWGIAGIMLPWMYYNYYGDSSLITEYYPVMKKYIDYLTSTAEGHIVDHGLGDWYDYGDHAAGYSQNSPISLSATSHYYFGAMLVAKAARLLKKEDDATEYQNLAESIRDAFNKKFYNSDTGIYGTGSQFSEAVPIYMGIVEPENKKKVMHKLLDTIRSNNYRLTTGDVGNKYLFQALAENDKNEVMYKMQNHYDTPGYGFQIKFGLTTLTEQWDPRNGNSLNHFMMGQIEEWFYKNLAGILPDDKHPGFKHFYLEPEIVGDMTATEASFESRYGMISSKWKKLDNNYLFEFSIPANSSATVKLPVKKFKSISINGVKDKKNNSVFELGSGNYKIRITQ